MGRLNKYEQLMYTNHQQDKQEQIKTKANKVTVVK